MGEASELWQVVFLLGAVLFVLLQVVHGWRRGPVRQATSLLAVLAAYVVGAFLGAWAVPILRPFLTFPDFVLRLIGSVLLGLSAYLVISIAGSILFKKTANQEMAPVRFAYGVSGALLGLISGLITVWVLVLGIRITGTVAETRLKLLEENARAMVPSKAAGAPNDSLGDGPEAMEPPPPIVENVAKLKRSVEMGVAMPIIKAMDVVPEQVYRTLDKLTRVVADPAKAERFLKFPGAAELARHPKILKLQSDPVIAKQAAKGHYLELLQNPKVIEAANDPTLSAKLKKFELDKAMDYALQNTSPARSSPTPKK